ncbi:MAG: glycosyltransferase [Clostridia bacterium]|nr:glycosyltransferase [Clostridia bacterium]MBQ3562857.1 glycosyltransferase [Clostridia bacterium]
MIKQPLVSIIIPCYNHEAFLDDCLGSILAQTYPNIELLICDDCSPDNSYEKIMSYREELEKRFNNVIILKNEINCGVTKNVNRMLKLAKGEFVKTLASDDCMAPDAISEMVHFLIENSQIDVVVSNGIKVSEEQRYPDFSGDVIYNALPDFSADGFFIRVAQCNQISAPAAMVRMSVYEKFGLYDENIKVEDFEFWLRIFKDGKAKIAFLDKDLIYYRINANSMSSNTNNKTIEKRRKLLFDAEIQSLYKYKDYFEPHAFAEIILNRIIAARGFAVSLRLKNFNMQLEQMWKEFPLWNCLTKKEVIGFKIKFLILTIKKLIKN